MERIDQLERKIPGGGHSLPTHSEALPAPLSFNRGRAALIQPDQPIVTASQYASKLGLVALQRGALTDLSLNPDNYPLAKHWNKPQGLSIASKSSGVTSVQDGDTNDADSQASDSSTSSSSLSQLICDSEGLPIGAERLQDMFKSARVIFQQLKVRGVAKKTWSEMDPAFTQFYFQQMALEFPELRLCSKNWKANQIATSGVYSKWYARAFKIPSQPRQPRSEASTSSLPSTPITLNESLPPSRPQSRAPSVDPTRQAPASSHSQFRPSSLNLTCQMLPPIVVPSRSSSSSSNVYPSPSHFATPRLPSPLSSSPSHTAQPLQPDPVGTQEDTSMRDISSESNTRPTPNQRGSAARVCHHLEVSPPR
jgi:hypothetical protein